MGAQRRSDAHDISGAADLSAAVTRRALLIATAVVGLVHLVASWRISRPTVVYDELGYLGNARWLAGAGTGWEMPWSPFYAVGYPIVIAPVTAVVSDPETQMRAVLGVNALLLAALVPLLHLCARRLLGASRTVALLAATVGAGAPAAVAAGSSAIAENLALPLVPAVALAAHRLVRPGPWTRRIWLGPVAAALYATHPRFTVALPVAAVVLALVAARQLAPRWLTALSAGAGGVIALAAWALARAVRAARWDHVERLEGGPSDVARLLTERSGLAELTWTLAGQLWYLVAGSLGLTVIGLILIGGRLRHGAPLRPSGGGGHASPGAAARIGLLTIAALAVAVLTVSVAFFAQNQFRADHLVYGRHNDSFTPLWLTAAVVALQTWGRAQLLRAGAAALAALGGLHLVVALSRDATDLGALYSPFAVPALMRAVEAGPSGTYERATLLALAGLAVVVVGAALVRRPRAVAGALLVWAVWSGLAAVEGTDGFEELVYQDWVLPDDVRSLGIAEIEIDGRGGSGFAALAWPHHLPEIRFTTYEPALGETPSADWVLARTEDEHLRAAGARIVLLDQGGYYSLNDLPDGMALWVRPGPEMERMRAEDRLLPAGFPTGLPETARRAELEVVEAGAVVTTAPGGRVEVAVRGRHTGAGSPWPDHASFRGPARVRIIAEITAEAPGGPGGGRSGGELPSWILPGEAFTTRAEVFAVGVGLEPLPPGRYRVTLRIGQDEPAWTAGGGPASTFTLVVTG